MVIYRYASDSLQQQLKSLTYDVSVNLFSAKARIVERGLVLGVTVGADRRVDE